MVWRAEVNHFHPDRKQSLSIKDDGVDWIGVKDLWPTNLGSGSGSPGCSNHAVTNGEAQNKSIAPIQARSDPKYDAYINSRPCSTSCLSALSNKTVQLVPRRSMKSDLIPSRIHLPVMHFNCPKIWTLQRSSARCRSCAVYSSNVEAPQYNFLYRNIATCLLAHKVLHIGPGVVDGLDVNISVGAENLRIDGRNNIIYRNRKCWIGICRYSLGCMCQWRCSEGSQILY